MTPQRTLIIYSGPTSTDRTADKNGMYMDNMNYFLEHGVDCKPKPAGTKLRKREAPSEEGVKVNYVFVLTQEVADYYTGANGKITKKRKECESSSSEQEEAEDLIKVVVRQDRCYDMESMRIVLESQEMDVGDKFDNLLFINCGLVGPKFGPGSPTHIPTKTKTKPYHHWSQIYTSHLSPTLALVGHSINTHFHTYHPHVQSFLYALSTSTAYSLLQSGSIYDCGLSQSQLAEDPAKRFELIQKYEVGMSTTLLQRGYSIGTPFINRWKFGTTLIMDGNSTMGMELDDTVCDIWYEDTVRNLTETIDGKKKWWRDDDGDVPLRRGKEDTFEYHQWDILPWDYYVFFKVSRLVPRDIQDEMRYSRLDLVDVEVVENDPRKSNSEYWRKRTRELDGGGGSYGNILIMFAVLCVFLYRYKKRIELHLRFLRKTGTRED